jgi:hypothetical protein
MGAASRRRSRLSNGETIGDSQASTFGRGGSLVKFTSEKARCTLWHEAKEGLVGADVGSPPLYYVDGAVSLRPLL